MARMDVTQMSFAKLYPLLVSKAEKKVWRGTQYESEQRAKCK